MIVAIEFLGYLAQRTSLEYELMSRPRQHGIDVGSVAQRRSPGSADDEPIAGDEDRRRAGKECNAPLDDGDRGLPWARIDVELCPYRANGCVARRYVERPRCVVRHFEQGLSLHQPNHAMLSTELDLDLRRGVQRDASTVVQHHR